MDEKSGDDIVIEELDSSAVPENELKYFKETQPLNIKDVLVNHSAGTSGHVIKKGKQRESEEVLIQKYMNGEVAFNDFYTSLGNEDNEDDDEDVNDGNDDDDEDDDNEDEIYEMVINDDDDELLEQATKSSTSSESNLLPTEMKNELHQQQQEEESPKERKPQRKKSILTATLQGLMGEANLSFARGQIDIAEKICLEIIRQNPLASEPFFTLAQIYEIKDEDKSLEFLTIAAHLDPSNRDQWLRIAELNIEKKQYSQAKFCYTKAIHFFPKDYELRLLKSKLFELMGDKKRAMLALIKMIPILPPEKYEYCLETAKNIATYFVNEKIMRYALQAMENAYKVVEKYFDEEYIYLYLELLVINQFYHEALLLLKKHASIEYITETDTENDNKISVVACVFPDDMCVEYRIKGCICLIRLKAFHLISYIMENAFEFVDVYTNIEGYIDIVEALMYEKKFHKSLRLLQKVVRKESKINIPPYVWLRYAESNLATGNINKAITSYQKVVELAPFCYDAKFTLSSLLKSEGKYQEAVKALEQDLDAETFNPRLLYEHCWMLKTVNEIDQYIEGGYILLARLSLKFQTRDEMLQTSAGANQYRSNTIKSIFEGRRDGSKYDDDKQNLNTKTKKKFEDKGHLLSMEKEYDLFEDLLKYCSERQKYGMMQKLCFAMFTSKRFRTKFRELEKYIITTSLYNDDPIISFLFLREILSRNPNKKIYWNLCNLLIQKYDSVRYHRYFKRLLNRIPTESYYKIFLAHYHLSVCSYKYALNLYVKIFKDTNDPLVALCIAVVFSQMSTQKNSLKRQTAASLGIAFTRKYSELRSTSKSITEQEIHYNLGRIYHHTGMLNLAEEHYIKALEVNNDYISQNEKILGLREEIAFNLHLIYKASGNYDMARKYLYKYVIV